MLDLESEVHERPRALSPLACNILPLDFFLFWHIKASDDNIGIIANFV